MKTLQAESSSPLYYQLMERIRYDISKGAFPVGSRIPPEHEIETSYGVSRVTVRRALQELTNEGLLERKQGKGTYVAEPRVQQDPKQIHSFTESCRQMGKRPGTRVIHVSEVPASEKDRSELNLAEDTGMVIETMRLRQADGETVMLEINHFSMAYSYLSDADLNGSLYLVLRDFGVKPDRAIHDISLTRVNEDEAGLLNVPVGMTVILLQEVIFDQKGRPLHNSRQLIRGDRFTLRI